jgi:predicted permease
MIARWRRFLAGLGAIAGRHRAEQDLDDELRAFVDEAASAYVAAGVPPDEAYRRARRDAGNLDAAKDSVRDVGWETTAFSIWQDIRYALRLMRRAPGFSAAAILTLGLGIGGTTAVFRVVDALFLSAPDGVANPSTVRRVFVRRNAGAMQASSGTAGIWSDARELNAPGSAFVRTAAYELPTLVDLNRGESARQVRAGVVSADFFAVLGVPPAAGRLFVAEDDDVPGKCAVAVISHEFWHTHFGGAADAVGSVIVINGQPLEVIGVTARGFRGIEADPVSVWLPSAMAASLGLASGGDDWRIGGRVLSGSTRHIARLSAGATVAGAASQATAALQHAAEAYPDLDPTPEVVLEPLVLAGLPIRTWAADLSLWTALAAGCLLLIACANVAHLMLGRAVGRRRELAMRLALGASTWRIARQQLTESLVLGLFGGAAGLAAASAVMGVMQQFPIPPAAAEIDLRLVAVCLGISIASGVAFGLLPARRARRVSPLSAWKGTRTADGTGRNRSSRVLVAVQVTLSLTLLVGAALFVRSLAAIANSRTGGEWDQLLLISAPLAPPRYTAQAREDLLALALDRLATLPGVERASIAQWAPLAWVREAPWKAPGESGKFQSAKLNAVGAGYFETTGTRVLAGRTIQSADMDATEPVAVVNNAMARALGGIGVAVGQCVPVGRQAFRGGCTRVIGVVEGQRNGPIDDSESPTIFAARTRAASLAEPVAPVVIVRTAGRPEAQCRAVQAALQSLPADLPYFTIESMNERLRPEFLRFKLGATLFGLFGVLAAALSGIGLSGLLGHFVAERTGEFGVRRALGASREAVLLLVLRQSLAPVTLGLGVGLVIAFIASRFLGSFLFGIEARDPIAFAAAAALLVLTAIIASLIPGWRAVRVDPMAALRRD